MMGDVLFGMHLNILKWLLYWKRIQGIDKDLTHLLELLRRVEFNIVSSQNSDEFVEIYVRTRVSLHHLGYEAPEKQLSIHLLPLLDQRSQVSISSHL
jgi:hypothetical protein